MDLYNFHDQEFQDFSPQGQSVPGSVLGPVSGPVLGSVPELVPGSKTVVSPVQELGPNTPDVGFILYKWFIVKKSTKVNVWSLLVNN